MRTALPSAVSWVCFLALAAAGASVAAAGCGSSQPTTNFLSREEMIQPTTCAKCHASHFNDWTASMHAKAADDPVFIAMNKRGQRETKGQLGTFCVQCHAPMAVRDHKTTDGLNLDSLPAYYKGVTCFFCHTIDSVGASHNNATVTLSGDVVMRGEYRDPVENSAHASTYSTLHDDTRAEGAAMCGSCHDIDSPAGGHIERTFAEWSASVFSTSGGSTCSNAGCHMTPAPQKMAIATGGRSDRTFHGHEFPAVDVPLQSSANAAGGGTTTDGGGTTTDGGAPAATAAVQKALDSFALQGALCVSELGSIQVVLDTSGVGHHWPSGAAQDRRAWAEVVAFNADGSVMYKSGVVPDGTPVTSLTDDPDLWVLRDCMFDAQSKPVVNFWEAAKTSGYELPTLQTFDHLDPRFFQNHISQTYPRENTTTGLLPHPPARVTLRIRIQPVGLDVLQDLVDSKDLDPGVIAQMPTFDVSLQGPFTPGGLEWTPTTSDTTYTDSNDVKVTCANPSGINLQSNVPAGNAATCPAPM